MFFFKLQDLITMVIFSAVVCSFMGIFSFRKVIKHLLGMLVSLEFLVLIIFFIVIFETYFIRGAVYFSLVYLIFRVCEGALGLTILVSMARRFGGDYMRSFRLSV